CQPDMICEFDQLMVETVPAYNNLKPFHTKESNWVGYIVKMDGVTYYIAHLIIKKANDDTYIVGSRGSVGSSFAATMGGITEVNPLPPHYLCNKCKHFEWSTDPKIKSGFDLPEKRCPECGEVMEADGQNIPFETFLGFKAEKVPDIDLNFPPDYQSRAHAYARELLSTKEENEMLARGETLSAPHVIRAGTISCAESKNVYGFAKAYFREVLHQSDEDQNKALVTYIASRATGVKRTTGQHPGGIVVIPADMDIFDFTPFQHPADDLNADWLTTHYEFASMHDCLLKLDLLGHVDPMALRMMAIRTNVNITDIPVNDPKVLSLFSTPEALGLKTNPLGFETGAIALPEFGTNFVQGLITEVRPKKFNDLLIVSGLSHGTDVWNNNAQDYFKSGIATLDQVIGCRDDIMTYLISMGVDSSRAFKFMEYVRKNKGGKPLKDDDVTALRAANVPEWYIDSCRKIKYLFPRAHATAYVIGSCRVGWFKIYKPLVFYAVYFSARIDKFNIKVMSGGLDSIVGEINRLNSIRNTPEFKDTDNEILKGLIAAAELWDRGFKISNIDLNKSMASEWVVDDENSAIIPPFSVLSGLGESAAQSVVDERKHGEFISIEDLRERTKLTETDVNNLKELGVLDGMSESNQLSLFDFF
ncbi:MAG: PolC-type DNA polymerase III, partial [Bacilli bacterium]|nr:PolC-type DNA polymerase III [Bacilli bacterium]